MLPYPTKYHSSWRMSSQPFSAQPSSSTGAEQKTGLQLKGVLSQVEEDAPQPWLAEFERTIIRKPVTAFCSQPRNQDCSCPKCSPQEEADLWNTQVLKVVREVGWPTVFPFPRSLLWLYAPRCLQHGPPTARAVWTSASGMLTYHFHLFSHPQFSWALRMLKE